MVQGLISKQHSVFNENGAGSQHEGGEQVDMNVVPGAAELSEQITRKGKDVNTHTNINSETNSKKHKLDFNLTLTCSLTIACLSSR